MKSKKSRNEPSVCREYIFHAKQRNEVAHRASRSPKTEKLVHQEAANPFSQRNVMTINHKKIIFVCGRMIVVIVTEFDKGLLRGLLLPTECIPSMTLRPSRTRIHPVQYIPW